MGEDEYNDPYRTRPNSITNRLIFAPYGQYGRISDSDRIDFNQVLSIWRPEGEKPIFMLRWKLTEWCNYKCPYCPQTHDRFARIGKYAAHAFDNYPLAKWVNAFSHHFHERRLSLVITGGEPMLDRRNMVLLLKQLTAMPTVECIRIDTNTSWKLDNYREVDPEKIILNCSYHPSQVSKESFLNSIKQLLYFGYKIGMVNFIMGTDNFDIFKKVKEEIVELGIPINPNPQFNLEGPYSTEHLAVLKEELPHADFLYKTQGLSPYGSKCLFPSLAYQMDQTGQIHVGCHPQALGNFFDNSLPPTFIGPVPCPKKSCMCLDMYSFLKDVNRNKNVNPLLVYSDALINKYFTDKNSYNKIKLYYFSTLRNFGDALNIDILDYLGAEYSCVDLNEANFIAIGSIIHNIIADQKPTKYEHNEHIDVWGSGFIKNNDCEKEYFIKSVNIHALRGKLSKARCEAILGSKLDGIALGDPGLLTSRAVTVGYVEKKYDVGIIPHYVDKNSDLLNKIKLKNKSYRIIDVQGETDQICKEICECRMILSSAMHGLVAADSYGVPNRWVKFSDDVIGGNYKFNDYYSAFDIEGLEPVDLRQGTISDQDIDQFILNYPIIKNDVERICDDLEKAFPRRRVSDLPMSASCLNKIESERNESIAKNKQAIDYYDLAVSNLYSGDFKKAEEIISKYKAIINYDSFSKYDRRSLEYPELSIIIVAYNTGNKLVDCVESLLNNNDGNYEIIIVDNGGNEKGVEKLVEFRLLYISSPHNFGPSESRNIGAYFAKGGILAFLDDDAIVGKGYVRTIIESFRKYEIIGLRGKVFPKTNHYRNKEAGHYDLGGSPKFIKYVNTEGNCAFSKNEYVKLNGMNPLLFGHEGIELSYRLEKSHSFNRILYSPKIIINHDYACTNLKYDTKIKRHQLMMSYLKFIHPNIENFIADIDYSDLGIRGNMNISFSIIMPTYNRKHCINNAINSLLAQTYKNFELIIIDDGSTDGTEEYVNNIYKGEIRKEKIIFIRLPENQGASFARNEGLRRARYDWIGYLDTDNQMHSNFLATYVDGIERNPTSEVFYAQIKHTQSQAVIGHDFDFDELVQFNFIDLGVFVHSRKIYNELGGFDVDVKMNRLNDWDLIIKYTEKYPPIFIEKVLLDYDDNLASSRITNTVPIDDAYKKVILNYYERIPAPNFIEKHTGRIQQFKRTLAERDVHINNLNQAVTERDNQIADLVKTVDSLVIDRDSWKAGHEHLQGAFKQLSDERDMQIADLAKTIESLVIDRDSWKTGHEHLQGAFKQLSDERDSQVLKLNQAVAACEGQISDFKQALAGRDLSIDDLKQTVNDRESKIILLNAEKNKITSSHSWKITMPLRFAGRLLRGDWVAVRASFVSLRNAKRNPFVKE